MSVVSGRVSDNNPFRVRENFSNNRHEPNSSPNSQDTESMSTTQDDDFKNLDRSSSFQTSTSSPTLGSESTVKDLTQHEEVENGFYSAPSYNHNGLININHANHFRKSMSTFDSMTSIHSKLSTSSSQVPATETPTKRLGMTNSPSIQALGAILTSKSKSSLSLSRLSNTIEEEESDDILDDDIASATQRGNPFNTGNIYNSQHNQSVATFYSAVSSQSFTEAATIKTAIGSQLDNPSYVLDNSEDLISLSSTIKDESFKQSPYKQESIGKANRVSILQAASTPIVDENQMTPHLFSPAMLFTQPVQGLQILLPSNVGASATSSYAHLDNQADQSQASISPQKIGYEDLGEDSFLADSNVHGNEPIPAPDFSMRLIDDNSNDMVKKESKSSNPHRNSLFDTPLTEQNDVFPFPTVSPLPPTPGREREETTAFAAAFSTKPQEQPVKPKYTSMLDVSPTLYTEPKTKDIKTNSFDQSKDLPDKPPKTEYNHQAHKSEIISVEKPKKVSPVIAELQDNSSNTKKFGFKNLFKTTRKTAPSKEGAQSPQLSSSKPKSPRLSFGMPSPALSSHSNHSRSKSFSSFGRFSEEVKEPKKAEPQKSETKKVETNIPEIKGAEKNKDKRKSMLSSWKRKSFSFGKPTEELQVDAKLQKNNKKNVFSKSKSMSNFDMEKEKPTVKAKHQQKEAQTSSAEKPQLTRSSTGTSLLETYGFNSASTTPRLDVVFSTPDMPITATHEAQNEQVGNYIVSDNANTGAMTMKEVDPLLLTPKKAQFVEPFDEYQIELPFTPSPTKPQRKSLAPQYQGQKVYNKSTIKRDASVSSGLKIDFNDFELPSTPQLRRQQHAYRPDLIQEEELQFHKAALTSSPKVHIGDSLFPKSLGVEEVESIVTLERSKSMRSVKSRTTSLHNGASIVEMMHDDVDRAVTADGMVVLRSPGFSPSNVSFGSPRSSKRASILKSPTKKHTKTRSIASDYQVDLDFDDTQLTDLIAMFDFSDGNIDTNFNLDPVSDSNMLSFNDISEIESSIPRSSSLQESVALKPSPLPHLNNIDMNPLVENMAPVNTRDAEVNSPLEFPKDADTIPISPEVQYANESQGENDFSFSYTNDEMKHQLVKEDDMSQRPLMQVVESPVVMQQTDLSDLLDYVEDEESEETSDEESLDHQINTFLDSGRKGNTTRGSGGSRISQYHHESEQAEQEYVENQYDEDDDGDEEETADPFSKIPASYDHAARRDSLNSVESSSAESIRFTPRAKPQGNSDANYSAPQDQGRQQASLGKPVSFATKGLKGPSFNQSLKPATRSAILGSIAKATGPRQTSISSIPLPAAPPTNFATSYLEDDQEESENEFGNGGYEESPIKEQPKSDPSSSSSSSSFSNRPSIINRFGNHGNRTSRNEVPETTSKPKTLTKKKGYSISKSRDSLSSMAKLNMFSNKSTSSTNLDSMIVSDKQGVKFSSRILLYDTYNEDEYDRHPETATCNQLTPMLAQQIKDELNEFKAQMFIHEDSRCNTHFF